MPHVRLRIWFVALLVLPLAFVGFTAWSTFEGGRAVTGVARAVVPLAWVGACLGAMCLLSLQSEARIFTRERTRLAVRALIQCTFALAAIAGTVLGQFTGMLAGIDYIPPDPKLAQGYAFLFVVAAAITLVPALAIAFVVALLFPRFWNLHLSLISQEGPQHA